MKILLFFLQEFSPPLPYLVWAIFVLSNSGGHIVYFLIETLLLTLCLIKFCSIPIRYLDESTERNVII